MDIYSNDSSIMGRKIGILIFVFLSGCLVERLLVFKSQLKSPIHYFDFQTKGIIICKDPVLEKEDIKLISGIEPSEDKKTILNYHFIRPDAPNYSFSYKLLFKSGKLKKIHYPESFYKALKASFALNSLLLFGEAKVPENNQWVLSNKKVSNLDTPLNVDILQMLGPATIKSQFHNGEVLHYIYKQPTENGTKTIKVSFTFDNKVSKLSEIYLQLPDRNWRLVF
ncbi:MAG: hypothetical protein VW397_00065 [Candidatus Margulisiibacteriota bacterium]